ncbi:MAG: MarR family winged helix-turn-helix transcriptional regulator [Fusobacteriaceae bacterium]
MDNNKYLKIMRKVDDLAAFLGLYFLKKRTYNTGEEFTQIEVHMLEMIIDNPNISSTEIAKRLFKTKSSVSQIIKKLVEKKLIEVDKKPDDLRAVNFNITEKGYYVYYAHKNYDNKMSEILKSKMSNFTPKELEKIIEFLELFGKFQLETSDIKSIEKNDEAGGRR